MYRNVFIGRVFYFFVSCAGILLSFSFSSLAQTSRLKADETNAVILSYTNVGEDYDPDNSIQTSQFLAHIEEIVSGGYHVVSMPALLQALHNHSSLPAHSVVIVFDGGYASIMKRAVPALLEHGLPFTVFVAPDRAREGSPYLNVEMIKNLRGRSDLVTFGLQAYPNAPLVSDTPDALLAQLNRAKVFYRDTFGEEPMIFSYPEGEYDEAFRALVKDNGYQAALGYQAGSVFEGSDLFALPRFLMMEKHGDLSYLRFVTASLPLPADHVSPSVSMIPTNLPLIGFNIDIGLQDQLPQLSCYITGQDRLDLQILGHTRAEIRLAGPLDVPTHVNCTIPLQSHDEDETVLRARWLGFYLVPPAYHSETSDLPQPELP